MLLFYFVSCSSTFGFYQELASVSDLNNICQDKTPIMFEQHTKCQTTVWSFPWLSHNISSDFSHFFRHFQGVLAKCCQFHFMSVHDGVLWSLYSSSIHSEPTKEMWLEYVLVSFYLKKNQTGPITARCDSHWNFENSFSCSVHFARRAFMQCELMKRFAEHYITRLHQARKYSKQGMEFSTNEMVATSSLAQVKLFIKIAELFLCDMGEYMYKYLQRDFIQNITPLM